MKVKHIVSLIAIIGLFLLNYYGFKNASLGPNKDIPPLLGMAVIMDFIAFPIIGIIVINHWDDKIF